MSLAPGARLGPYEIQSPLGSGGMGEVYKAKDTRLDRIVAIKVLPSHVSHDPALRERFEQEARSAAARGLFRGPLRHNLPSLAEPTRRWGGM